MKYRPELPPVFRGISMIIAPKEKIGVVGRTHNTRTGAGKSSIMMALHRIVELSAGSIEIDGIDISSVGLTRLRKSLTILPQDAFPLSGTLQTNLDPFGLYDDARLWDALKQAHLLESYEELGKEPDDFHTPRTCLSLARALASKPKILILDEATASMDYETNGKI
ncbi:hypothetical protein ID866_10975 [Astraeus odoratus]|nr:hypothetical protein ID866_10975 [Astraeus odoratus]